MLKDKKGTPLWVDPKKPCLLRSEHFTDGPRIKYLGDNRFKLPGGNQLEGTELIMDQGKLSASHWIVDISHGKPCGFVKRK